MKRALQWLTALSIAAYPVAVYLGLARFGVGTLALLLAAVGLLRLAVARRERQLWPAAAVALGAGLTAALMDSESALRYYPVMMNLAMLLVFGHSLWRPPTVIERIARIAEPQLAPAGVRWTRTVTQVWCGFFVLNGLTAFLTARYGSLQLWALYNGLIAYLLMGLLLGGEYLLRRSRRMAGGA